MRVKPSGDRGIIVNFGNEIKKEIHYKVRDYMKYLQKQNFSFIEEMIPSYTALLIIYYPELINYNELELIIKNINRNINFDVEKKISIVHIPVVYGKEYGPDLEFVAKHNKLTKNEVVQIHSERKYLIYMLGFTPGFPFLGGMSNKISTPRLEEPRTKISPGSVGIAGNQTGIYPIESPGGWRLIGRTPLKLFLPEKENPFIFRMGDYIKFDPIEEQEYHEILKMVDENKYKLKISKGE